VGLRAGPRGLARAGCGPGPGGPTGSLSCPTLRFFCGPVGRARGPGPNCQLTERNQLQRIFENRDSIESNKNGGTYLRFHYKNGDLWNELTSFYDSFSSLQVSINPTNGFLAL